jgi:SAM-dependent methyltransferase
MTNSKEGLIQLYSNKSKHSNYQILPSVLKEILSQESIQTTTRSESERLKYMVEHVDFNNKSVLDIGANTGYFTFESISAGAASVHYFEGNKEHSAFVELAVDALGLSQKIKVTNKYYNFDGQDINHYDIGLLLNVLHHIGDDYGDKSASIEKAKDLIIQQLNAMTKNVGTLIFQLGFNWHGNISQPLFANGTKREMIEYIQDGVKDFWTVETIGVAERVDGSIMYVKLNDTNIERDNSLGEFLNRPIFILKSKSSLNI